MTSSPADSSGVPWQGRSFDGHPVSTDDGSAPPLLRAVLQAFRAGGSSVVEVVDAVRASRLLVPLVAELGDAGVGVGGRSPHKSADLAIVTVEGPDGRRVLPVFSSVDAMKLWNPDARPVPSDAVRVALAAASEGTELVVLDPMSATEFAVRRPALWAIAQQRTWVPSFLDDEVHAAFRVAAEPESSIIAIALDSGDPTGRLAGPELVVAITVRAGLDRTQLDALLQRLRARIADHSLIASRVDSMVLRVVDSSEVP